MVTLLEILALFRKIGEYFYFINKQIASGLSLSELGRVI